MKSPIHLMLPSDMFAAACLSQCLHLPLWLGCGSRSSLSRGWCFSTYPSLFILLRLHRARWIGQSLIPKRNPSFLYSHEVDCPQFQTKLKWHVKELMGNVYIMMRALVFPQQFESTKSSSLRRKKFQHSCIFFWFKIFYGTIVNAFKWIAYV